MGCFGHPSQRRTKQPISGISVQQPAALAFLLTCAHLMTSSVLTYFVSLKHHLNVLGCKRCNLNRLSGFHAKQRE